MAAILPGATLGILGGGQLGRMFAFAAKRMGYRVITLDPTPDSPCGQVCDEQIIADYTDESALRKLAAASDVITYEFENIDAHAVEFIESLNKVVHPNSHVLRVSQDRLLEKKFLRDAGLGVTPFASVNSLSELEAAQESIGLPAVLKTVRGGYDGKGQAMVYDAAGAQAAFARLYRGHALIWEKKVDFTKELSVVACRDQQGTTAVYPVSENVHVENILDIGMVPARISERAAKLAREMAESVGRSLGIVGTYCVEMFFVDDENILVNEIAPRPHNSGHYTIDAANCSQFEQQVRAICGLPLGEAGFIRPSVMANILGDGKGNSLLGVSDALRIPSLALHLYGKPIAAAKRKMGHFTVLGGTLEVALHRAQAARAALYWG